MHGEWPVLKITIATSGPNASCRHVGSPSHLLMFHTQVYFGAYTLTRNAMGESPMSALVAGALAGVSFWPVVLPMDCLKSRYQTAPDGTYKSIGEVYTKLLEEEGGPAGLFRGIGPAMIRAMPANAISFLGAELTKKALAGM